jgi:flagellar motor switch protein FliM
MSDETLSKDEVDALLHGMEQGDVAVEGERAPRGAVRPYDLLAADRLGTGQRVPDDLAIPSGSALERRLVAA